MKIIDENGVELTEAPDLTLGRLVDDVEIVHHEATADQMIPSRTTVQLGIFCFSEADASERLK